MATPGRVTVSINLRWVLNNTSLQGTATEVNDQIGEAAIENVQFIGTTSEAVDFGDVSDPGWLLFKNFDQVGGTLYVGTNDPVTASNATVILEPGKSTYIPASPGTSTQWFAVATAADTKMLVIAVQR